MWFWKAHNAVNKRLAQDEGVSGNDPNHPKIQWPSFEQCKECRLSEEYITERNEARVMWREDAVYDFLLRYYHGHNRGQSTVVHSTDDSDIDVSRLQNTVDSQLMELWLMRSLVCLAVAGFIVWVWYKRLGCIRLPLSTMGRGKWRSSSLLPLHQQR
jgi:hypothetical protein